ncbi:V-type ATP synthase subunit F [Eubacteriales bacterium OttesenSCG-928-N13]|nr:V-type ATP synthase subunit F [Eubacteriales bacterium OttesenSCG-928-N13]
MPKVAAIGSKDVVLAFKALGITAASVSSPDEARQKIHELAKQQYAVIFITEDLAESVSETISRYKTETLPAIIPIPGASGSSGLGMKHVRANVEKAVGADILFNNSKEEG